MNLDPFAMIDSLQASANEFLERAKHAATPEVATQLSIIASLCAALSGALIAGVKGAAGK